MIISNSAKLAVNDTFNAAENEEYSYVDIRSAALELAAQGVLVFPCRPSKLPATKNGFKDASTEPARVRGMFTRDDYLIGVPTGASGLTVLDEDPRSGGNADALNLPETLTAETPSGGRHFYFKNAGIRNSAGKIAPGIDVRGEGGYVVIPPSEGYRWINNAAPAEFPNHLQHSSVTLRDDSMNLAETLDGVPEGQRDTELYRAACKLRSLDTPRDLAEKWILEAAGNCDPPFDPETALKKVEDAWKFEPGNAGKTAEKMPATNPLSKIVSAKDLANKQFKPVTWVVPDVLPEGVTLLAGKPKMGKSLMALGLCVAVASGGSALGKVSVSGGSCLYLALEENERRLKSRYLTHLRDQPHPEGLDMVTEWPRVGEGCEHYLREWLNDHPDARLIVIDTLKKIRPQGSGNRSVYDQDYEALEPLLPLAAEFNVSILVVHHLRKMDADDPLDAVSGSTGLTGGVDGIMVLNRERGNADAFLYTTGRDVDDKELALTFEGESLSWILKGDAAEYRMNEARRLILEALTEEPNLSATAVAQKVGKPRTSVGEMLRRMEGDGLVVEEGNKWRLTGGDESDPSHPSRPSGTSDPSHPSPTRADGLDHRPVTPLVTLGVDEQAHLSDSDGSDGSDGLDASPDPSPYDELWEASVAAWERIKIKEYRRIEWEQNEPDHETTRAEYESLDDDVKAEMISYYDEIKGNPRYRYIKDPADLYYEFKGDMMWEAITSAAQAMYTKEEA